MLVAATLTPKATDWWAQWVHNVHNTVWWTYLRCTAFLGSYYTYTYKSNMPDDSTLYGNCHAVTQQILGSLTG